MPLAGETHVATNDPYEVILMRRSINSSIPRAKLEANIVEGLQVPHITTVVVLHPYTCQSAR
ncbi:hypothetical protein U9M48_035179 [Paspalum notatum var. saurae]|uniref:Uncharacterized protein n=1 Tax=Paspalum notatum var. saurae TaxID=547442 RepID=A0AAQ3UEC8_PASNO